MTRLDWQVAAVVVPLSVVGAALIYAGSRLRRGIIAAG